LRGHFQARKKEKEREGREENERKERNGEDGKTPLEIHFWLRSCMRNNEHSSVMNSIGKLFK